MATDSPRRPGLQSTTSEARGRLLQRSSRRARSRRPLVPPCAARWASQHLPALVAPSLSSSSRGLRMLWPSPSSHWARKTVDGRVILAAVVLVCITTIAGVLGSRAEQASSVNSSTATRGQTDRPSLNIHVRKCKVDTVEDTAGTPLCSLMPAMRSLASCDPPDPGPAEPIRPQHPGRQASDRAGNGC